MFCSLMVNKDDECIVLLNMVKSRWPIVTVMHRVVFTAIYCPIPANCELFDMIVFCGIFGWFVGGDSEF